MFGTRRLRPDGNAAFDGTVALFVSLASFTVSVEAYVHSGKSLAPNNVKHFCTMQGRVADVVFRTHGLLHSVSRNSWPTVLQIEVYPPSSSTSQVRNDMVLQSKSMSTFITRQLGNCFIHFYESTVDQVKSAFGNQPRNWPPEWRLAWMLRNAIAHGDRWTLNDLSFPDGTWRSIKVTPSNNGELWFDLSRHFGGGDMLLLMLDLSQRAEAK